jgi:hypothetical protein
MELGVRFLPRDVDTLDDLGEAWARWASVEPGDLVATRDRVLVETLAGLARCASCDGSMTRGPRAAALAHVSKPCHERVGSESWN